MTDGSAFFLGRLLDSARVASLQPNPRMRLFFIHPSNFLRLAEPTPSMEGPLTDAVRRLIRLGHPFSELPRLDIDGDPDNYRVLEHEGRHRAFVLEEIGVTRMPVVVRHRSAAVPEHLSLAGQGPCRINVVELI